MEFSVFDVKVKIKYSLFLVLLIAVFADNKSILNLILFSSLHELGHIFSLCLLGGKVSEINFAFYGIGMKKRGELDFAREIIFLLSGIGVNSVFVLLGIEPNINFSLLMTNLMPIYPLDGGRCLKLLLDRVFDFYLSYKLYYGVAAVFFVAALCYGLYEKNFNVILICLYLFTWLIRGNYD